ncbi:MAG: hypothetical protein MJZ25_11075 [Fibrobacter sp.]|nr:hypothetical protein [Fibrobacter sp.]
MQTLTYDEFLNDPLKLEERYPTIEEFALAFDDFFTLRDDINRSDYEDIYNKVRDGSRSKTHRTIVNKDTIKKYIECFDLGNNTASVDQIISWYIKAINKQMVMGSTKNSYIRQWFRFFFCKAFGFRESTTNISWIDNVPNSETGKDFFIYLNCLDDEKILHHLTDEANKKNYQNWKKFSNNSFNSIKIKSIISFLRDVNSSEETVDKRGFLINWFYSKCEKDFPFDEKIFRDYDPRNPLRRDESPYTDQLNKLNEKIDGPKGENTKEEIIQEISFLKKNVPPTDYPVLLFAEYRHAVYQEKNDEAIELGKIISDIFFYVGSGGLGFIDKTPSLWFNNMAPFVAHIAMEDSIGKLKSSASKLYTRLCNYSYLVNFDLDPFDLKNLQNFDFSNSDDLNSLKKTSNVLFQNVFLPSSFYNKRELSLDLKYDDAKLNQKEITFGNISGYAIEIAAQINDVHSFKDILSKGGDVTKTKNDHKNALYWSIHNMMINLPIGFWRSEIFPHSGEHMYDERIVNFIFPGGKKTISSLKEYHQVHAEELKKGREIFDLVISKYVESKRIPEQLTFFNDKDILYAAIARIGDVQVVEKILNGFGIDVFKNKNENYFEAALGLYSNVFMYRNGIQRDPNLDPFRKIKSTYKELINNPEYESARKVNEGCLLFSELTMPEYNFESSCQLIYEQDLLSIIKLLIANHFNPCLNAEEPQDYPQELKPYDSIMYAIELGWTPCVELLCKYIKSEFKEHWEHRKEKYLYYANIFTKKQHTPYPPMQIRQDLFRKIVRLSR